MPVCIVKRHIPEDPDVLPTSFLHLSDLHIREDAGEGDLDADLRNELALDVRRVLEHTGPLTGILITGDIASSGKSEEFDRAGAWLADLCHDLGLPETAVWTIPGNHDVDVATVKADRAFQDLRKQYRPAEPLKLRDADELFQAHVASPSYRAGFFEPLEAYNKFAGRYGCESKPEALRWTEDFALDDGSILRLHGLNSALISTALVPDLADNKGANRLYVGEGQVTLQREPGVAHVVLCHHPPDWLIDSGAVDRLLSSRSAVQLYGHEHDHRDSRVGGSIRLFSGALHPSRKEAWDPRYNVLQFSVRGDQGHRELSVRAWFRRYDLNRTAFVPHTTEDGDLAHSYTTALESWTPPGGSRPDGPDRPKPPPRPAPQHEDEAMPVSRRLRYDFHLLSFVSRTQIGLELGLIEEGDDGLSSLDLANLILRRAEERDRVEDLDALVRAKSPSAHRG